MVFNKGPERLCRRVYCPQQVFPVYFCKEFKGPAPVVLYSGRIFIITNAPGSAPGVRIVFNPLLRNNDLIDSFVLYGFLWKRDEHKHKAVPDLFLSGVYRIDVIC